MKITLLQFCRIVLGSGLGWLWVAPPSLAQMVEDRTLSNPSIVNPNGTRFIITGGTQAGGNLFHSFQDFSVSTGKTASFQAIDPSVSHIITRVTGSSISRINGAIEALQTNGSVSPADFFLINPNGIIFGRNASLNLGGSFLATTGDRLTFADGSQFRANGTQSAALLSVSVPTGIQLGQAAGTIHNRSQFNRTLDANGQYTGGLQVAAGRSLALVGGAVNLAGGIITATEGRVEIGSVAQGRVGLLPVVNGWDLDYRAAQTFEDIGFSQFAAIGITGSRRSSIQLRGRAIRLSGETLITSTAPTDQPGGDIAIRGDRLTLDNFSGISTLTTGAENGGNLRIAVNQLHMQGGSELITLTDGAGNGGDITVHADDVALSGQGSFYGVNQFLSTGILARAAATATAEARVGNITLTAQNLRLAAGAEISTTTLGAARGGRLRVHATTLDLAGTLRDPNNQIFRRNQLTFPTGLFADADENTSGAGGDLMVTGDRLTLRDGAVLQTTAEGSGDAGDLTVRAATSIEVTGDAGDGRNPSILYAASGGRPGDPSAGVSTATGRGGNLTLRTRELRLLNGGAIAVGSSNPQGSRGAGRVEIRSQRILLNNRGQILSSTASGNGGNIAVQAEDLLFLNRDSQISTEVSSVGNGGNIEVRAGFIVAPPRADSDLLTRTPVGRGGDITLNTQSLLGFAQRSATPQNGTNDLDPTGTTNGTVLINQLNPDPSRGFTELPLEPIAVAPIAQTCVAASSATEQTAFIVTGRGGLPPSPTDPTSSEGALSPWATLDARPPLNSRAQSQRARVPSQKSQLMPTVPLEAQGWIRDRNGTIALVTQSLVTQSLVTQSEGAEGAIAHPGLSTQTCR